jgi:hypothetical protein
MVGIPEQEFIDKMNELCGLPLEKVDSTKAALPSSEAEPPRWMDDIDENTLVWVDVLARDEKLDDPMPPINIAVNALKPGDTLGVKHKWQPQPLFDIWQGRGLEFWSCKMSEDEWHIFVHKPQ